MITGTPLGTMEYLLQFLSTAAFDETAAISLDHGTYLLFVDVAVSAQAQVSDGPSTADSSDSGQ